MAIANIRSVDTFLKRNILASDSFTDDEIETVLQVTRAMETCMEHHQVPPILANNILCTLFFEPSTRTRLSFETAMFRLGGQVVTVEQGGSTSAKKGESLSDMGRIVSNYADVIVMRHPQPQSVAELASTSQVPVINAGDGPNEHPTQALQDLYTIHREQGKIEGLSIALMGDLKYGRTVHSLLTLLVKFNVKLYLISHNDLQLPEDKKRKLEEYNASVEYVDLDDIKRVVPDLDVLYVTRIQEERFSDSDLVDELKTTFRLTLAHLEKSKKSISIMHPLPKVTEIAAELDDDPRATYFKQAKNGIYLRMALLALVLGKVDETLMEVIR